MAVNKIRPRKINSAADSRLRKSDEMLDAVNLVATHDFRDSGDTTGGNDSSGNAGVLKPCRGNGFVPPHTDVIDGVPNDLEKRVLGSVTDHEANVVYLFLWCEEAKYQGVYAYDPTGYLPGSTENFDGYRKIYTSQQFNFVSDSFIKADIVRIENKYFYSLRNINRALFNSRSDKRGARVEEVSDDNLADHLTQIYDTQPIIYFTDNINEPRKIHPFRALVENHNNYDLVDVKDFITACPKTPLYPITAKFETDPTDPTSSFEGISGFQFAYQHIYKGGEESALSTFSDIVVPNAYYQQGADETADLSVNNKCVLTIPHRNQYFENVFNEDTGSAESVLSAEVYGRTKEINKIRILSRMGNEGAWITVEEIDVPSGGLLYGQDITYDFYNRQVFAGFNQNDAIKQFDNIPQRAEGQAVVSDRLMYSNYVEGYDNVDVKARVRVKYHDRPEDFIDQEIKVTPTIKHLDGSYGAYGEGAAGRREKTVGYHIDTQGLPPTMSESGTVDLFVTVSPHRNWHIYNTKNSFHGSRHLSLDLGEEITPSQDLSVLEGGEILLDTATSVVGPETWGLKQTEIEARGGSGFNDKMDKFFGANNGVSVGELGDFTWNTVGSQTGYLNGLSCKAVFGTSAANPLILRGQPLSFFVTLQATQDINEAQEAIRNALIASLTDQSLEIGDNTGSFLIVNLQRSFSYVINEGLPGGDIETDAGESIGSPFRIPVLSGSDSRKHLICAVGNGDVINESSSEYSLTHQSPCGYFIVNKADVTFGLENAGDGFMHLRIQDVSNVDIQTCIPFMNAERLDSGADDSNSLNYVQSEQSPQSNADKWGLRDATMWSLDELIVDSWYCYSKEFMQAGNFNPRIYTPTPTDFPRYMNGEGGGGYSWGDLNPECTNNGQGKNAAIVRISAFNNLFMNPENWEYRYEGDGTGEGGVKDAWHIPFQRALDHMAVSGSSANTIFQAPTNTENNGRMRMVGYLNGNYDEIYDTDYGYSMLDGGIGPGSSRGGQEALHAYASIVYSGAGTYKPGSVTGEVIFAGRISPRGHFIPAITKNVNAGDKTPYATFSKQQLLPLFGGGFLAENGFQYSRKTQHVDYNSKDGYNYTYRNKILETGQIQDALDGLTNGALNEAIYMPKAKYHGDPNSLASENDAEIDLFTISTLQTAEVRIDSLESQAYSPDEVTAGGRSFKTRATHAFGVVYYDERGRSGNVNPIIFNQVAQGSEPFISKNSEGVYVKGYSDEERSEKGRVSMEIELLSDPPEWAHHYQIVYAGNVTKGNFIQYSTGGAFITNFAESNFPDAFMPPEDLRSTNIYVSLNYLQHNKDVSYAEAFGAVSPLGNKDLYIYKPGDKLRVLAYYDTPGQRQWPHQYEFDVLGQVELPAVKDDNELYRAFQDNLDAGPLMADVRTGQFLILKNNPKAVGFSYNEVKQAQNLETTNFHNWNNICTVEIYSPSKVADLEEKFYYEIGAVFDILKDENGNVYHKSNPVEINRGDVWFRVTALAVPEFEEVAELDGGDPNPHFEMYKNLILFNTDQENDQGKSTPRFKNYYVESMTFNDTFAGNDVLGIGKPKVIRSDEGQIRKRASVIYSDKHIFNRKNIKFPSFNGSIGNFKDLPNEYGAINYIQNNYDSLLCIQENKSSLSPVERNIISDAGRNESLVTTSDIIGVQAFFAGEYGADNNPESVVRTEAATYFASKSKSEVYRLTSEGIQIISEEGMKSYFYRVFEEAKRLQAEGGGKIYIPGGYDPLKDEFLITISNLPYIATTGVHPYDQPQDFELIPDPVDPEDPTEPIVGCMDPAAENYDPDATFPCRPDAETGLDCCKYPQEGCADPVATNYNPLAEQSCVDCCVYFDPCSFDEFSENPDGSVLPSDILYIWEEVIPQLTPEEIQLLGWDFAWVNPETFSHNGFGMPPEDSYNVFTGGPVGTETGMPWDFQQGVAGNTVGSQASAYNFALAVYAGANGYNVGPWTANTRDCPGTPIIAPGDDTTQPIFNPCDYPRLLDENGNLTTFSVLQAVTVQTEDGGYIVDESLVPDEVTFNQLMALALQGNISCVETGYEEPEVGIDGEEYDYPFNICNYLNPETNTIDIAYSAPLFNLDAAANDWDLEYVQIFGQYVGLSGSEIGCTDPTIGLDDDVVVDDDDGFSEEELNDFEDADPPPPPPGLPFWNPCTVEEWINPDGSISVLAALNLLGEGVEGIQGLPEGYTAQNVIDIILGYATGGCPIPDVLEPLPYTGSLCDYNLGSPQNPTAITNDSIVFHLNQVLNQIQNEEITQAEATYIFPDLNNDGAINSSELQILLTSDIQSQLPIDCEYIVDPDDEDVNITEPTVRSTYSGPQFIPSTPAQSVQSSNNNETVTPNKVVIKSKTKDTRSKLRSHKRKYRY